MQKCKAGEVVFPSQELPDILINADDHNRVSLLAERCFDSLPYVSAYQRVMFRVDDDGITRIGRLRYPNRPWGERGNIPILGPVGAALIGMKRNASIEWVDEGRVRTLTVLDYGW